MRENVLLEIASLFTKIVALSAFGGILPRVDDGWKSIEREHFFKIKFDKI